MNSEMKIENAKYLSDEVKTNYAISVEIDGSLTNVPVDSANRHYIEISKRVKEGTLTIKDAD